MGELRWAISTDILTLDPANASERNTTDVLKQIVETLVTTDANGKPVPCLAKSWEVSRDGLTYVFHLNKRSFSDGSALTSEDVKASLERVFADEVHSALGPNYLGDIVGSDSKVGLTGLRVINPDTVQVRIKTPAHDFLAKLSYPVCSILPKRLAHKPIQGIQDLVGSGPYVLSDYKPKQRLLLTPNPYASQAVSHINRILIPPIVDPATRLAMFNAGDLDICPIAGKDVPSVAASTHIEHQLVSIPQAKLIYLQFNSTALPALSNPKVRQAIAKAIDRKRIVESLMFGTPKLAYGLLPSDALEAKDGFDPTKAKSLLAEAGYAGGKGFPKLQIACNETNRNMPAVEAIASDLRSNLNIDAEVQILTSVGLGDLNQKHQLPVLFTGWTADYDDPQNTLYGLLHSKSGSNGSGYRNPEVDKLLDTAAIEQDPSKRLALYGQIERIAANDLPILPLLFPAEAYLFSTRFSGIPYNAFGFGPMNMVSTRN